MAPVGEDCRGGETLLARGGDRDLGLLLGGERQGEEGERGRFRSLEGDQDALGGEAGGEEEVVWPTIESMEKPSLLLISLLNSFLNRFGCDRARWLP